MDAAGRAADDVHDDYQVAITAIDAYEGYDSDHDRSVGLGAAPLQWRDFS
jgi:hypothetical protein